MLPELDGLEFLEYQRRDSTISDIPVLVTSASSIIDDRRTRIPAAAVLPQPFTVDDLLTKVAELTAGEVQRLLRRSGNDAPSGTPPVARLQAYPRVVVG